MTDYGDIGVMPVRKIDEHSQKLSTDQNLTSSTRMPLLATTL